MNLEDRSSRSNQFDELNRAIEALEAQRATLGNEITDIAQASIRERLARLQRGVGGFEEPQERKKHATVQVVVQPAHTSSFTITSTWAHDAVLKRNVPDSTNGCHRWSAPRKSAWLRQSQYNRVIIAA